MKFGPWIERLEAIAVGREVVAIAGWRDAPGVATSPRARHSDRRSSRTRAPAGRSTATAPVRALAFAGDELLLTGGDDGRAASRGTSPGRSARGGLERRRVGARDRGRRRTSRAATPARSRSARADGALHLVAFAISGRHAATFARRVERRALGRSDHGAVAFDPGRAVVAGGADGQLWIAQRGRWRAPARASRRAATAAFARSRASAMVARWSAAATARSGCASSSAMSRPRIARGDHGHQGAVRGLVLGPVVVDDAGREQPRRLFTVGEDGAIKCVVRRRCAPAAHASSSASAR